MNRHAEAAEGDQSRPRARVGEADAKPADVKAADAKPADAKPTNVKAADVKPKAAQRAGTTEDAGRVGSASRAVSRDNKGWGMRRRRTLNSAARSAVTALCTAAVVLQGTAVASDGDRTHGGTAQSADVAESADAAEPAEYDVAEDAEAVKGATSSTDAPELAEPGYFTDSIGRGEEKYYRVDLDAKSTAYLSALAHPKAASKVGNFDALKLELQSTDGERCSSNDTSFGGDKVAYPIGDMVSRRIGVDESCQTAGPYLFKVSREDQATSDPGDWPIELRYMLEPGLKGSLPAPPPAGSWSSEPPSPPSGEAKQVRGGSGISSAPAVGDGVWRDKVLPGETRFYQVPLDWGQQIFARAELPNADVKKSDGSGTYVFDAFGLNLFSPTGAEIVSKNFQRYQGEQNSAAIGGRPVEYGNRFDDEGRAVSTAGFYTVAITLSQDLKQYFPNGVNLTLRVKIKGAAKEAPNYEGDAQAAGFALTDEDKDAAKKGMVAAEAGDNGNLRWIGVVGIGAGVALLLGLGLWTLIGRRRLSATNPVHPVNPTNPSSPPNAAGQAPTGYPPHGAGPEGQQPGQGGWAT